jgi:hypothetical protein
MRDAAASLLDLDLCNFLNLAPPRRGAVDNGDFTPSVGMIAYGAGVDLHFIVGLGAFEPIFDTSIETFAGWVSIERVRHCVRFLG